jgi:NADH:ubiquinone oxidoreductase subunit E
LSHLRPEFRQRAEELVALYPHARSAMLPLCHLAQEQDGYLSEDALVEVAELTGTTPAEVRGTASFYDLFHLEPVGTYVVGVCTNIACLLDGGLELLAHASDSLGVPVGGTTPDGVFTLEECECLGDCDVAPCVQVNSRFVRTTTPKAFDALVADLRAGSRVQDIPRFGVLSRVRRSVGLAVPPDELAASRTRVQVAHPPSDGSSG